MTPGIRPPYARCQCKLQLLKKIEGGAILDTESKAISARDAEEHARVEQTTSESEQIEQSDASATVGPRRSVNSVGANHHRPA